MNQEEYYNAQKVKGQSFTGTAKIIVQYLINDIKKKPRSFKIGFLSAIQSAFQLSPVIFLTIGEDQVGDADVILTPISFQNSSFVQQAQTQPKNNTQSAFSQIRLLNSSQLKQSCENVEGIQGCSPRWILLGNLYNGDLTQPIRQKFRSYIIAIDSLQERNIGLGRRFKGDILEEGQAYVTATTMRGLGLEKGMNITLNIDIVEALLKNDSILNLHLKNQTNEAVQEVIVEQIRKALIQQYPQMVGPDGNEVGLSKKQIVDISQRMKDISTASNNPISRNALYLGLQLYLDSQNININAKQTLDPLIANGDFQKTANDLNQRAINLPDDYYLNSTTIAQQLAPILMKGMNITENFKVVNSVESPKGKWASALGNTIVLDSKYILQNVWKSISKNLDREFENQQNSSTDPTLGLISTLYKGANFTKVISDQLGNVNLNQYSITSNAAFSNRMEIYSGQDAIKRNIVKISNAFSKEVGKSAPIQSSVPLSTAVNALLILKMFLDNMIATSIFLLFMLAVLLIYSLMISDVEEKTYEFGMLRALGFQKLSLIYLLIIEGLMFAIPGLGLGLLMAYLLNSMIAYIIFDQSMMVTSYELHWSAVVLAFALGIFIPLISVYLPIQRAMSKTLRDSLDLYHRVVNEISISVQKLERLGISFSQFINSITLIIMGVVCYYFAPAAFVYQNIALFLAIINIVLILMIIGFTLLLNLAQPWVERVFVKFFLCFFRGQKHLEPIIVKNMEGHRRRNGKTALMYTVALSFLIFAGTGFNLQSKSIVDNLKSSLGSDLKILLLNDKTGLDEFGMRSFLDSYMKENPDHIQEYSFITLPLDQFPIISKPKFSSLSQFPTNKNLQVRGIEKNYLRSTYLDFYYPIEFDPKMSFPKIKDDSSGNIDAVFGLYSNDGLQKLDNSVDFFKISSNSNIRDQSQMGGGIDIPDTNDSPDDNQGGTGNTVNNSTSPVSRNKFEDKEIKLIIPSGLQYISSVDVTTPCLLNFNDIKYRARIRATAKKFPGFRFSSYRQISFYGEILTSTEQVKYLVDSLYYYMDQTQDQDVLNFFKKVQPNSTYGLPKSSLNVQFKTSLSRNDRELIGNGLRNYFKSDFTQLFDVPSIIEQVQDTLFFIDLFSLVVAMISIILSFFLILVSFVANIKENSWEFGVLRAIGLSKVQITRVYMIESCSLVLASGTIGTIIGLTVAITLTLQLLMFTELPFNFVFPYTMFFTTFFLGLFIAAAASYTALSEFKDKPISSIADFKPEVAILYPFTVLDSNVFSIVHDYLKTKYLFL